MSISTPVGDPPMSFNFCASNSAGDFSNSDPSWKYYTTDGTNWIPQEQQSIPFIQPITPPVSVPWIVSDGTFTIDPNIIQLPKQGDLRINPVNGMIERWDGINWQEYGKPLSPPPIDPLKPEDDFELGGAL